MRVAGGRLVMKTNPGLSPRSRRAENRCVPWLDVTDYRHSSCLAGDVGCENLRLGLLRVDCSLCPRWWMLSHRHLPLAVNAISRRARRSLVPGAIEIEIDGVMIRVGRGADAKTLMTVLRALKAGA